MNLFERKNTELIKEFNRYIREHPEFAESIPDGAVVVMQLEGDEEFNAWSRRLAESRAQEGQPGRPIVYIKIKGLAPLHSRIKDLELEQAAN